MKKMTKGAIVTGLGVALLLGGGGTLAVWNDAQTSNAGAIASGDLELGASEGQWSSNVSGPIANINSYRVVPGEKLTYKQPLTVRLVGDNMKAQLSVTGSAINKFNATDGVTVSEVTLTNKDGLTADSVLTPAVDGAFTASTSFTFRSYEGQLRRGVNTTYDLSGIGYKLEQIAPITQG